MKSPRRDDGRARSVLVLLVLVAVTAISLDAGLGSRSPSGPARTAASSVFGPAESAVTNVLSPVGSLVDYLRSRSSLREENERLRAKNAKLREQVNSAGIDRNRLAEYDKLARLTTRADLKTVRARVVGYGAAQSFQRTVTIDVGTSSGVHQDMTVVSPDGLVGRVVRVARSTATVLLIVDKSSVVGARLGSDNELGMLQGDGSLSGAGRLTLTATDPSVRLQEGDSLVSWGSRDGAPYVPGVPIGKVEEVRRSPRDQSETATVAPYVDFSSLDVVAVVVANEASDAGGHKHGEAGGHEGRG